MNVNTTLYDLCKASIGSAMLIYADQNSPRPALPYWTIRLSSIRPVGTSEQSQGVNTDGDLTITAVRECTIQLQRIGADSVNAVQDFADDLDRPTIQEIWARGSVALFDAGPVQNVPFKLDNNTFEPRASIDILVRFSTALLDRVGIIETVNTTAELATVGTTVDPELTTTIETVLPEGAL